MKDYLKTVALLVAAVIYVPFVIDWFMPGNGLHQTTVALGGYGPDALRPLGEFFLWDMLVRLIGWDLCGLGTLSMFGALVSLGLVAFLADRATRGVSSLSTGLVCAAFLVTPGFLRAATRPGPLMALLAVPLAGLASLVWALTKSGHEPKARRLLRKWWLVLGALVLAYGLLAFVCLDFAALTEDLLHLFWFAVLGVLPHLVLAKRMRRHTMSRHSKNWFLGIWIAAIALSAVMAVRSFDAGRASGRLAEQFIANAGEVSSIAEDPALADVYLWTLPAERRDAAVASRSTGLDRLPPSVERYLPTVDLWRTNLAFFVAMERNEPLRDYCQIIFRTCGDRLGKQLLDAGDIKGAWTVFRETLDKVDGKDDVAILGLCELIERGYEADAESLDWFGGKLLPFFSRMKIPERLAEDETETARAMQRAIRFGIFRGFVRSDLIGWKLLDLDLLLGDWESAERDAQGILMLDRQNVKALVVMGNVCGRRGDYAESERYLRRALETGKADDSVMNDLAFTLVYMGHAKEALPMARSLVRTDLDNWNFRETLALALIHTGELEEGGKELRTAANLARRANIPSRARIRLAVDRAWLFKKKGDVENLRSTLRVLKNLKGLERGLQMEIEEIAARPVKAQN